MDWDSFYRQDAAPPWSIGEPQPELAALIADGRVRSEVLDAGCGHAELSLELARQGYRVVGLDFSLAAVSAAAAAAVDRGLTSVSFAQADIADFGGYDDRFSTVIDSGLFHSLPVERRSDYLRCIARAAAPGAALYILSFGPEIGGGPNQPGPSGVTEEELRDAVSAYWVVDDVRPALLYGNAAAMPEGAEASNMARFVDGDRMRMPGFLLSAHKP